MQNERFYTMSAVTIDTVTAPVATVATVTLAEAVATYSDASDATTGAAATLGALALSEYQHALVAHPRYVGTLGGVRVLRDNYKREVAGIVWHAATGVATPPVTAERTAGEKTLASWLSRFARVATDDILGSDALAEFSTADVTEAVKSMTAAAKSQKESEESAAAALTELTEDDAYKAWLAQASNKTRDAILAARVVLRSKDGAPHVAAFIRALGN